jgi:hypothetical protein
VRQKGDTNEPPQTGHPEALTRGNLRDFSLIHPGRHVQTAYCHATPWLRAAVVGCSACCGRPNRRQQGAARQRTTWGCPKGIFGSCAPLLAYSICWNVWKRCARRGGYSSRDVYRIKHVSFRASIISSAIPYPSIYLTARRGRIRESGQVCQASMFIRKREGSVACYVHASGVQLCPLYGEYQGQRRDGMAGFSRRLAWYVR